MNSRLPVQRKQLQALHSCALHHLLDRAISSHLFLLRTHLFYLQKLLTRPKDSGPRLARLLVHLLFAELLQSPNNANSVAPKHKLNGAM